MFDTSKIPQEITNTLNDPACRKWLRDALDTALPRDPVDALADAEHLVHLLRLRLDSVIGSFGHPTKG